MVIVLSQHHLLSQSCGSGSSLAGCPQCPHAGQFVLSPKEQHELLALPHPAASHCSGIWLHPLAEAVPQLLALGEAGTDSRTTRSSQDLGQEAGNEMQEQEFLCESSWEQSAPGIGCRHSSLTPRMAVGVCRTCAAPGVLPQAAGAKAGWAAEPAVALNAAKPFQRRNPGGSLPGHCPAVPGPGRCHIHHPGHSLVLGTTTNTHSGLPLSQLLCQWLLLQKCSCSFALILVFLPCRFRRSQVLHPLPGRGEWC